MNNHECTKIGTSESFFADCQISALVHSKINPFILKAFPTKDIDLEILVTPKLWLTWAVSVYNIGAIIDICSSNSTVHIVMLFSWWTRLSVINFKALLLTQTKQVPSHLFKSQTIKNKQKPSNRLNYLGILLKISLIKRIDDIILTLSNFCSIQSLLGFFVI